MVLLTHQDTVHTRFSDNSNNGSSRAALVALEQPDVLDITTALQKAASFDAGHQATAATLALASDLSSGRANSVAVTDTEAGLDDAPFIVSGPLLPIRQARRGINPNRSYRIFGTPPLAATDIQQHHHHQTPEPIDAMFAPPTPVSASVSSASYSSRAAAEPGSRLGSGSSRASNKSSVSSSAGNSVSDTLSTLEDILAGRGRQIRVYDKHQVRGISELAMEPVVLSAHHSSHVRSHSSNARTPHTHGAESDGRSGSVRVSSLLPSARSSPMMSSRRGLSKSVSPRGSLTPAAGGGLAAHQYYVQRVPKGPLSEQERLSNELAARTASQICIASPKARLHEQKQQQLRALSLESEVLNGTAHEAAVATSNGEPSAYFADSEMDGNHFANISAAMDRLEKGGAEARAAARSSWNVPSDDNEATPTDRQRKRQAVRTLVVTEKFHVLPIPPTSEPSAKPAMPKSLLGSPLPASIFQKSFNYDAVDGVYGASSSEDERLVQPTKADIPLHGRSTDQVHTGSTLPSLDHRATSFDLGRIGREHGDQNRVYASGVRQASRTSVNDGVRDKAVRHTGTRSSTRLALMNKAVSGQAVKVETGYDGDSEGALRVPVQRRNTVAGDKIGEASTLNTRPARMKMPRNTSDYSDLVHSKEDRRVMRGSRRRPSANPLLPIGTQIAPGHANYVLMYNMLTGIRVSVSRCEAKDSRPVRFDDYMAAHKYSFDVVGDEMTPSSRYDFKFKDYAPW
ncbi:Phosphatidylinositol-4-phosphate 5-kinase, partial [Coemansia sp. 'formosensis']